MLFAEWTPHAAGETIEDGKPSCPMRGITVQDMKKALDNPSLGIKVIDVRSPHEMAALSISRGKPDEYEIAKVKGVPLLPLPIGACFHRGDGCRGPLRAPVHPSPARLLQEPDSVS